jgi:uncharacterized membrane-anchored protein YjiN (DUF445 family)
MEIKIEDFIDKDKLKEMINKAVDRLIDEEVERQIEGVIEDLYDDGDNFFHTLIQEKAKEVIETPEITEKIKAQAQKCVDDLYIEISG